MSNTIHPGLPVFGYREQPQSNVDRVNRNKMVEEAVLRQIDELEELEGIDRRWLAIGRTHLEQAFMAINRAIFKPERISLTEPPRVPRRPPEGDYPPEPDDAA